MQLSAEFRWFWKHEPTQFSSWFFDSRRHGCSSINSGSRIDRYLLDKAQPELGIKKRGSAGAAVEIKGLISTDAREFAIGYFLGHLQYWAKWTSYGLELDNERTIAVQKERWLRIFDTGSGVAREIAPGDPEDSSGEKQSLPDCGCSVELTRLLVREDIWWTFGFESFGSLETAANNIYAVALELTSRGAPELSSPLPSSYPAWLISNYGSL